MTAIFADIIILVGFPATGKSLVGKQVAQLLDWDMMDMDSELEIRSGKSILRIFAEDGEAAFRASEKALLNEACSGTRRVVSTGGGAVVDSENLELMLTRGLVICLDALPETIYNRLSGEGGGREPERPLLAGPDSLDRIRRLKADRETHYAAAHRTIATDNLAVEQVAALVVEAWRELAVCNSEKAG